MNRQRLLATALLLLATTAAPGAHAAEIGHFSPGVLNMRDFAMPAPGFYGLVYNYKYMSDQLNDRGGNEVDVVHIQPGPGPGTTLDVNVDLDVYALAPTFIWVSNFKILGANYGAYICPSFSNTSIGASLASQTGAARSGDAEQFAPADLFVQPLWLGWAKPKWDIAAGYGFYAPIGSYETETVALPVVGDITAEAADNIGLGFWTHQFQGAVSYYPWEDKRMAVVNALTYEIHGQKEDFDLTPGEDLSWNWAVSQYLPLKKDMTMLLEVGPTGYSSWQVGDDSGSDATNPDVHDHAFSAGGQVGVTHVPWNAVLNLRMLWDYAAQDRFQGRSIGLNLALKF